MKARYLGIVFVAAVLVPSVILSVISIRSADREEAYVEKQLTTTLLAEVAHTAALASSRVTGISEELHAGIALPAGVDDQEALLAWKKRSPLVEVPYLLSSGYRVLWPRSDTPVEAERTFLREELEDL